MSEVIRMTIESFIEQFQKQLIIYLVTILSKKCTTK